MVDELSRLDEIAEVHRPDHSAPPSAAAVDDALAFLGALHLMIGDKLIAPIASPAWGWSVRLEWYAADLYYAVDCSGGGSMAVEIDVLGHDDGSIYIPITVRDALVGAVWFHELAGRQTNCDPLEPEERDEHEN